MSVDVAIISGVFTTLAPLIRDEFSLFWNFKKEVQKLSSTLSALQAVLEDAETKIKFEKKDKQTEDWLRKLKVVAYEVRDIMDDCIFKDLHLQVKRMNASSSTRIQVTNSLFSNTWTRYKFGHKIKDVLEKLVQISSERNNLHLRETTQDSKSTNWRETKSKPSEKVYGRDDEKEKIVTILVNATEKLSVLPIHGLGGLGKTTLAQMVFNDEEITKYFDVKHWVYVSEQFDTKLVIKAIIGATNETSLEILQNKIQDKLRGKKYLIVLDDVWNDNVEEWNKLRSILDCGSNGAFILTTTRKRNVAEIMKTNQHFELLPLSNEDCWQLFEERAFMYGTPKTTNLIGIGKEIAQKCMGVPLVAKTLGSQLSFKSDEKDWCTIRDSEIWKISENQESILPILRLSYYDLPYPLRRCFAFCAAFPKHTEFEKERLIQLWMAHDLIPINKNQEEDNHGNTIWDELCWRSFFQDEIEDISWPGKKVQKTCMMHDFMHDLAQSVMKDECYTIDAKSSSENFRREIRHIMVMVDEFRKIPMDSLKKIGNLQSIILHPHNRGTFSKENLSVLKELSSLRVLEIFGNMQSQDLCYVGCLKHLRYLNLSFCEVKTLPNSICDLLNLQTLNLNWCYNLESFPKNMKDLINLRHLHLRGCDGLKYMPRGMGQLRHLKTLSLFVIGKESDGQLDELKELDIEGYMKIRNLESVSDASISRGEISMSKKSSINQLELHWNNSRPFRDNNHENQTRDEKICEALEMPTMRLKTLEMRGYKGLNIPKCVRDSSSSLLTLHLWDLENVKHLFIMNTSVTLFPLLKELNISKMENLRELVFPRIPITTYGAFPNLRKIEISCCSKLGALPPHLKSLKDVTVKGKCSDELLYSISDISGLTHLHLHFIDERSVLFPAVTSSNDMKVTLFSLLQELSIWNMKNLREIAGTFPNLLKIRSMENLRELGTFHNLRKIRSMEILRELASPHIPTTTTAGIFPNLRKIHINTCPGLGALPPHLKSLKDITVWGECSDELLYSISDLSGQLTHLRLDNVNERSVLFPCASTSSNDMHGTVVTLFPLLQELSICNMKNLRELVSPPIPINTSTRAFPNLCKIEIRRCPKLGALPPHLKSLKDVAVTGAFSDELLNSISNLNGLTHLFLEDLGERSVLFGGGNKTQVQGGPASTFQSLRHLDIYGCAKLSLLFDEGCDKLARGRGFLTNLNSLYIEYCPELMISLEQWRNLPHSLQSLKIGECPKLVPSKVEEAEDVIAFLRSLRERLGSDNFRGDILNKDDERRRRKSRRTLFLCN